MLFSTLIVAASAFAGASAQLLTNGTTYGTPIPCCSLGANQITEERREAICEGQQNTCRELCGGEANVGTNGNTCSDVSPPMPSLVALAHMFSGNPRVQLPVPQRHYTRNPATGTLPADGPSPDLLGMVQRLHQRHRHQLVPAVPVPIGS